MCACRPDEKLGGVSHDCLHSFLRPRPGFDPPGRVCTVSAPDQARVGGQDLGRSGWDSAVARNSNECVVTAIPGLDLTATASLLTTAPPPALGPSRPDTGRSSEYVMYALHKEI